MFREGKKKNMTNNKKSLDSFLKKELRKINELEIKKGLTPTSLENFKSEIEKEKKNNGENREFSDVDENYFFEQQKINGLISKNEFNSAGEFDNGNPKIKILKEYDKSILININVMCSCKDDITGTINIFYPKKGLKPTNNIKFELEHISELKN